MRRVSLLPSLLGILGVLLSALPAKANLTDSLQIANDSPTADARGQADTQLEEILVTFDGFLFRLSGQPPRVDQDYDENDRELKIELRDSTISSRITQQDIAVDRYGVERIRIRQDGTEVDIVLYLRENSSPWRFAIDAQGVRLVPTSGTTAGLPGRTHQSLTAASSANSSVNPGSQPTQVIETIPVSPGNHPQSSSPGASPTNQPSSRSDARARIEELLRRRRSPSQQPSDSPSGESLGSLPNVADRNLSIVIDPGHGGPDPGAVGIDGIRETDIVLDISLQLANLLERQGMRVSLTRQDERDVDLPPRVSLANRTDADLFISVHANAISMSRPDVNGVETYYYSDSSQVFAEYVQNAMLAASGMRNRGVKFARFFVIRRTLMPAILVEVGFVTGVQDAPRLADPEFRRLMAEAIARGILQYVQQN